MKPLLSIFAVGTFLLVAAINGCATQQGCSVGGCTSDEKTAEAVAAGISAHPSLGPPGQIRAASKNRIVYLTGLEDTPLQVATAEAIAANTDGVADVVNNISVTN